MRYSAIVFGLLLSCGMVLLLPGVLVAQEEMEEEVDQEQIEETGGAMEEKMVESKLPQEGSFHLDLRALTLFNTSIALIQRDEDPNDEQSIIVSKGALGTTWAGAKIGYLIGGHHDVGGHLLLSWNTDERVLDPEDDDIDEVETLESEVNFRLAAYYNYNWHVSTFVMPYVGPLVGFETWVLHWEDKEIEDSGVNHVNFGAWVGVEGGVKLFPFEHVAFDISMMGTYASIGEVVSYEDEDIDEDVWLGGRFEIGLHAGLNIYF